MAKVLEIAVNWYPQPKQAEMLEAAGLLDCIHGTGGPRPPIAPLIGYGGAVYGGKTDGDLGLAIVAAFAYPGCNIGFFRRTFPELNIAGGAIKRSEILLTGIASFNKSEHTWLFPNGSRLQFCFAANETDVLKFKSSQFDILIFDEATTFTWFQVDFLMTRNRATVDGITPFTVMTTNPGDIGHAWYLQVFDTINALGPHQRVKRTENPNSQTSEIFFIPAFISDNEIGLQRDPGYAARLERSNPDTARAMLRGDWTVFAGQAFPPWAYARHVQQYRELPGDWPTWRSLDYGFDHPTFAYWFKRDPGAGRIYVIREWQGRQMTDPQLAEAIKTATLPSERILFTFASPDMWEAQRQGYTVTTAVQTFASFGLILTRADNHRVNGKRKINNLLANLPDGQPGLVVFDNCPGLIKAMPTLVRDMKNPEDVKKIPGNPEDDAYDAFRYGLTNYQLPAPPKEERPPARNPLREVFA